jgi:hypothetical protein
MFLYASHRAALEIVEEAGWDKILLNKNCGYMWFCWMK